MAGEQAAGETPSAGHRNSYIIGLCPVSGEGGYRDQPTSGHDPAWGSPTGHPLLAKTKDLARTYKASKPGPDAATESVLADCTALLAGRFTGDIVQLERILSHRLYRMREANKLVRSAGLAETLQWPPIANWDWEEWSATATDGQPARRQVLVEYIEMVKAWELFPPPARVDCGRAWDKPERYVAAAFLVAGRDPELGDLHRPK
jgi:hypothetical protein